MAQVSDPAVALAVVNEAKAQGVFPGQVETDPGKLVEQANQLVTMAEQAKAAGANGAPVLAVIAASEQAAGAAPANPFENAPPAPAPVPQAAPAPPPAPPAPPAQVKIAGSDGTVYEVAGGYTLVQDAPVPPPPTPVVQTPPAAEPEPAPAPAADPGAPVDPSQYATTEPWPGYKTAKIEDIVSQIENLVRTDGEKAKTTLAHVWEYEKATKERKRLISKLTEIAQNGVSAEPAADDSDVKNDPPFDPAAEQTPAAGPPPTPAIAPPVAAPPTASPPAPAVSDGGDLIAPISNGSTGRVLAQITNEGLPVPAEFQGQAPAIPEDFTALSDIQVRQLQGQFNALYARAVYLGSVAAGHANDAKVSADAAVELKIRTTDWPAKTTVKEMEAQASADENVQQARRIQHEYGEAERQYRHLAAIYLATKETLSREQTGRENDNSR